MSGFFANESFEPEMKVKTFSKTHGCSHHPQDFWTPRKEKLSLLPIFLSISNKVMGPDAKILLFLMLSFKPAFSLSSFILIKRFFSSSSLSATKVVSSVYLRLLIFLLAILIPV